MTPMTFELKDLDAIHQFLSDTAIPDEVFYIPVLPRHSRYFQCIVRDRKSKRRRRRNRHRYNHSLMTLK